jgi:hypothetical protein
MKRWHKSFLEALFDNDLVAARQIRDINLPKKLYQYCSFSTRTLINIVKGRMWLSNPINFNDPYDTALNLLSKTEETAVTHWEALHKQFDIGNYIGRDAFVEIYLLPDFVFYSKLYKILEKKHATGLRAEIRSFIELAKTLSDNNNQSASSVVQNCFFVGCMAENYKSILMWSHYANHHRGLCLEYDMHNILAETKLRQNVYPVVYSDKLFDGSHLFTTDEAEETELLAASLNKSRAWAYEE